MLASLIGLLLGAVTNSAPPCAVSGRLCAPDAPNTSVAALPAPPLRIALLLPLRSETLGAAAASVRAGFMAAHQRDAGASVISVIDSGESEQTVQDSYAQATQDHDILVGPLSRAAVAFVAASPVARKPTIALSVPEKRADGSDVALPESMLVAGLSNDDEARQVALWAGAEHPRARALIVQSGTPWQKRIATAFATQWKRMGLAAEVQDLASVNRVLADDALSALEAQLERSGPTLVLAALEPSQLRQLRTVLGDQLPLYGTASASPGPGTAPTLDGLRLLGLPWLLQPEHPAVMAYARSVPAAGDIDLERLYALGIDAFRIAHAIALRPQGRSEIDGVTGRLTITFGQGPAQFERALSAVVLRRGAFVAVPQAR